MKRIILFLAGILVAGSVGVALNWPSDHGLVPRAAFTRTHSPSPSVAPRDAAAHRRLLVSASPTPSPATSPVLAPAATPHYPAPTPSATPPPSYAPTPTPVPTPPAGGCGRCGGGVDPVTKAPLMCPMATNTAYCIDTTH